MTDEEWGPWIEHDGKGCPASLLGRYVQAVGSLGTVDERVVRDHIVFPPPGYHTQFERDDCIRNGVEFIVRYRVRKPRALKQLRELVENLPERVDA